MYFSNLKKVIEKCIILILALMFVGTSMTSSVYAGSFYDSTQKEFVGRGINVKWYGAKGNGKNDDTLAIRKAISKLRDGDSLLKILCSTER